MNDDGTFRIDLTERELRTLYNVASMWAGALEDAAGLLDVLPEGDTAPALLTAVLKLELEMVLGEIESSARF